MTEFEQEALERLAAVDEESGLLIAGSAFMRVSTGPRYSYNFFWLGRPIIQYPQDMVAMQELIWQIKPDLIIETGIAHGGSLILSASMLALLDYCDAVETGALLDPTKAKRTVLGIDIDIRAHNRTAIEAHPLASRIDMIQGSSIDPDIIAQVHARAAGKGGVLVCLDSNHTHDHVLAELEAYAPLVSPVATALSLTPSSKTCAPTSSQTAPGAPATTPRPPSTSTSRLTRSSRSTNRSTTNS